MPTHKLFSYAEFKKIYSKVPRLSVDVIVKSPAGIALTLRSIAPYWGQWHIPGSTMLYKETVLKTVHRVAHNELKVSILNPKHLGYIEYNEEKGRGFSKSVSLVFVCKLKSGKLAPDGDASEAVFFSRLPKDIIPVQKKFLEEHWKQIKAY